MPLPQGCQHVSGPLSPAIDVAFRWCVLRGRGWDEGATSLAQAPSLRPPLPHSGVHSESRADCGGEGAEPWETPCGNPSPRCLKGLHTRSRRVEPLQGSFCASGLTQGARPAIATLGCDGSTPSGCRGWGEVKWLSGFLANCGWLPLRLRLRRAGFIRIHLRLYQLLVSSLSCLCQPLE